MSGVAGELRVLRVLTRANLGGPARQCVALSAAFAELGIPELCVIGSVAAGESELPLPGVLSLDEALTAGRAARGFVRCPRLVRRAAPLADRVATRTVIRLARAFGASVIHTHTAKAGLVGARAAGRLRLVLAHTYHGHVLSDYFSRPVTALLRAIERRLCRRRNHVFCVSASCLEDLHSLGVVPLGEGSVIEPAIHLDVPRLSRERARAELGIGASVFAVAFCGRLVPVKDPLLAVDVLRCLSTERSAPVVAVCFGSGPLADAVREAARGIDVRFVGARPDFPTLLSAFDALLMTSRREGLPLAALEALSAGVPVVGPAVPGIGDLRGPGVVLAARTGAALAAGFDRIGCVPQERIDRLVATHDPGRVARCYVDAFLVG